MSEELDEQFVQSFAWRVRELFPGCPTGREEVIATHACRKYSGRVGRSVAAKALDAEAVELAVIAHIRHEETRYDELLSRGWDRREARDEVKGEVEEILGEWEEPRLAE